MDLNRLCRGCFEELPEIGMVCPFCGFDEKKYEMERPPEVLPLNTILRGSYLIGKYLGKGGFGITYIGWHISLETVIAIKEFYPTGIVFRDTKRGTGYNTSVYITDTSLNAPYQKAADGFKKEARMLWKIHVPGVVSVHDCFDENNTSYFIMDYIRGYDLKSYLKMRGGKISEEETMLLTQPVIDSLKYLHARNIIHRDISPPNILLNDEGEVILVDFGAARSVGVQDNNGRSVTVVLKHGFAPIEQYNTHGNQGPWTDIYALCATMYKMMTGITPDAPSIRIENEDDEELLLTNLLNNNVSKGTCSVLIKGLKIQSKDRFKTVEELESALISGKLNKYKPSSYTEDSDTKASGLQNYDNKYSDSVSEIINAANDNNDTGLEAGKNEKNALWLTVLVVVLLISVLSFLYAFGVFEWIL